MRVTDSDRRVRDGVEFMVTWFKLLIECCNRQENLFNKEIKWCFEHQLGMYLLYEALFSTQ